MEHSANLKADMLQIHLIFTSARTLSKDYDSSMNRTISMSKALFYCTSKYLTISRE